MGRGKMTGRLQPGTTRPFATTLAVNVSMTVFSAGAGLIIARAIGPSGRGEYAAIVAWFGLFLVIGEVGQTAATTYFSARDPQSAPRVLATSRRIMTVTGSVATILGLSIAPLLAHGSWSLTLGYWTVFASCLPTFVGASYTFTLQARDLSAWNIVRISQPAMYLTTVVAAWLSDSLTLEVASAGLAATVTLQTVVAYVLCRRGRLTGGAYHGPLARPLIRYGVSQVASSAPTVVNTRLDQILLSQMARSSNLGLYAVAVSLSSLASPVIATIGNVLFPRFSAEARDARRWANERRALAVALAVSMAITLSVALASGLAVPILFGARFKDAIPLVWILAPGGVFLAVGLTAADLLRARGRPGTIARSQALAAVFTLMALIALLPRFGATGAAWTSSGAYGLALFIMIRALRHEAAEADLEEGG